MRSGVNVITHVNSYNEDVRNVVRGVECLGRDERIELNLDEITDPELARNNVLEILQSQRSNVLRIGSGKKGSPWSSD
ncbi:hypothetical protein PsorP6_002858 [Peronosclerospora sorghi]|uniref:Uncharacterized protein n=1 Tax=Peronosclerospora sorghi TaxID=230839 RepID=A0ACC0VI91_9STRA|nr:hypothetical protein PsorP6_002858 [Peronosclerospora sorghi]